MNRFIFH